MRRKFDKYNEEYEISVLPNDDESDQEKCLRERTSIMRNAKRD